MKTILLTGGGTGGHVIPHLSLIPQLKQNFDKIYYIGSFNGIEKEIMSKEPVEYFAISAPKLKRDAPLSAITIPFKLIKSICSAKKILKKLKPNIVFSKGGYVSVPVCIAAKLLQIPVISHESDLTLGLANKIIYKVCSTFCTSFPQTAQTLKKAVYTGAPIRESLFKGNAQEAKKVVKINNSLPTILVMGGSTGALNLNKALYEVLPSLTKNFNIIHLVGKNKGDKTKSFSNYTQLEYCQNIQDLFCLADLIVSRAGSNAIFEFLALKKPMLLIPLSKKASRGDQIDNANYFESLGLCKTLLEANLTPSTLQKNILQLYNQKNRFILNMQSPPLLLNGTENILKEILKQSKI